jgi:CheY-like chemotaxis protein
MTIPAVLVVDPNPATHRRVAEAFDGSGWTLLTARDAREAEEHFAAPVRVLLASASLPGGNGYDLARSLRDRQPQATVLLMTGGYEIYNAARAEAAEVTGHLAKPFSAEGLRRLIEETVGPFEALAGHALLSALDEELAAPAPVPAPEPARRPAPSLASERVATILPRDYKELPLVAVDPDVVGPALERAVMEVLPEVVEAVLRQALVSSPAFRDLVSVAVEEAVRSQLPAIAARVVEARLAEIESSSD